MNLTAALRKSFATSPILAAAAYAGLVFALLVMLVSSIGEILRQRAAVASTAAMLEQLEGRKAAAPGGRSADALMPSGSAFLEGATVTRAGAVTKLGGNVLSSQLDFAKHAIQGGICQHGRELRNRSACVAAAAL